MSKLTYKTKIIQVLSKFGMGETANPDTTNSKAERLLGEIFLWDTVEDYAKKKSDALWKALEETAEIDIPDAPGTYSALSSRHFSHTAKVSNPRKYFSSDVLAGLMKKKHKVPEPATLELIEASKVPGKCAVTKEIVERIDE